MHNHIRNFVIIAHVDHGKSTLADRFLEITGTVPERSMRAQYLDQLELERERGITIKMAPVRMLWHPDRGSTQMETQMNADTDNNDFLYKDVTYKIRGAAFAVANALGYGLKESAYQHALEEELRRQGLRFTSQPSVQVIYAEKIVGHFRPDLLVEDTVLVELKAQTFIGDTEKKQTWSYLKGSSYKLALLINFGPRKVDIERIVYDTARHQRESASHQRTSAQVEYVLNLIDTPGHSDFAYEVSRALAAVEGGILLVDASQGIQAQTLANLRAARAAGLTLIGAVNKIDLFQGDAQNEERLMGIVGDLAELLGVPPSDILRVSGKTGEGVAALLEAIITKLPPPRPRESLPAGRQARLDQRLSASDPRESAAPVRALVFDSFYDNHKGVVASVRVFQGNVRATDEIYLVATGTHSKIKELGCFTPQLVSMPELEEGMIGYVATGVKDTEAIRIGDTMVVVTTQNRLALDREAALPGYREPKPVVFVSFYPESNDDHELLTRSLKKLKLNDAGLVIEPDQNEVLGRGYKLGFLGRLHFEIAAERLAREWNVRTVNTFPSVRYRVRTPRGWEEITQPDDLPADFLEIWEPMVSLVILVPTRYAQNVFPLHMRFRMTNILTESSHDRVEITAQMPLAELVSDFDDQLKSLTEGYASFSYELAEYAKGDIERAEIVLAGTKVPGLSRFFPKATLEREARKMAERLKEILPHQQYTQSIQVVAGGRVIAREDIKALRKDVTGYLYGGDRSRKMKLWKKQQRGKKRLKERAEAKLSPELFKELLKK